MYCFFVSYVMWLCFDFFFSSRRRHTRYIGDWSSDVCSSDLFVFYGRVAQILKTQAEGLLPSGWEEIAVRKTQRGGKETNRSEERRVGKECRSRWATEH